MYIFIVDSRQFLPKDFRSTTILKVGYHVERKIQSSKFLRLTDAI